LPADLYQPIAPRKGTPFFGIAGKMYGAPEHSAFRSIRKNGQMSTTFAARECADAKSKDRRARRVAKDAWSAL